MVLLGIVVSIGVAATPPKLALVGFTALDVSEARARYYTDQLGIELTRRGFAVTTPADLAAVLGVERQKQLLGCEESSCIAELFGGLGADGLVVGQVAKTDARYRLSVKVLDQRGVPEFVHASTHETETSLLEAL